MGLTFVEGFIVFTRMVTALAGAGDIFCGITGIDLGIKRYNEAKELAADDPTLDDKELKASALSIAVISSYLIIFGLLIILSEVRYPQWLLAPFKFLKFCLGRAFFDITTGVSMIIVGFPYRTLVGFGIFTCLCGLLNLILIFPCFPTRDSQDYKSPDSDGTPHDTAASAASAPPLAHTQGQGIGYGADEPAI